MAARERPSLPVGGEMSAGDIPCQKCGTMVRDSDRFCTKCGAGKVLPAETLGKGAIQWKWVAIAAAVILATQFGFTFAYAAILAARGDSTAELNDVTVGLLNLLGFGVGGFIVALRSPGSTIREPAIAAAISVTVFTLLQRIMPNVLVLGIIYGLALLGAKLGEAVQSRRSARAQ